MTKMKLIGLLTKIAPVGVFLLELGVGLLSNKWKEREFNRKVNEAVQKALVEKGI